ncbi:PREDICTED: MAP3K7 C-terminal-like protein, partial [Galeopterus variegatus]|uniref:MAP3K7 C-terminal-like protein n=1 Tax=Galeopterus variegatus TaxID=482537 RepID=A0ABM0SA97_GALVR
MGSPNISVLCSATSLAMLEDHPKVSELATGDWVLTQKPKSITVPVEIPRSLL